jgi:ABC-type nitrate/sulfonate/bicarbonate transport system substrate-binding protein
MQLLDFASHHHAARALARRRCGAVAALCRLACATLLPLASACAAADSRLGAPGTPVQLSVGYMPYASSTWSGVVMRGKKFYEQHLPAGSSVTFASALDGAKVGAAVGAGQHHIGYLDDVATLRAAAPAEITLVAALGVSHDQCSVLLVRPDAPRFASGAAALGWLQGRTLAAPKDSCMERFARLLLRQPGVSANLVLDQNIEVITAGLRAGRLDAAVVSEPSASRLVGEGSARRVASGAGWQHVDAAGLVMRTELLAQRPDVALAWLRAELEAQQFLADPANAGEIMQIVAAQTSGFEPLDLWQGLYGRHAELEGGSSLRLALPFVFDAPALRPGALRSEFAERVLRSAAPARARREVHALAPPPALAARAAGRGRLDIRVDEQGWGSGDARRIATVLEAVAGELLSKFPGRPLAPIRVSRSMQSPVALYERGPGGETRIELTASGADAGPYVYEFAHEFCHVLSNYERHPHHAVTRNHQWFEEALCEVASLYTLKTLALAWQTAAPSAELAAAAPQLRLIADRFEQESHRKLPASNWPAAPTSAAATSSSPTCCCRCSRRTPSFGRRSVFSTSTRPGPASSSICRPGSTTRRRATRT